ncbi:family 16 glycosylhydrolase [Nocardioides sp. BP30]|uniref:family 16 glycosylhydrolase n=1 Tax=Nocardioides sp. BP30 TaxID=3036374 RepID=UPI0024687476|nr:family 16 glycosylhydrolase [Nocardioides sp. BP30]WGL53185.1 family 16 glycosylhydrolase [Nocardioides sp. BP30]
MFSERLTRPAAAAAGLLALPLLAAPASAAPVPGPVHAGNTFGWYPVAKRYEFVGPLGPQWRTRGDVRTQNGMLTLLGGRSGDVTATLDGAGHARGRWEIRWRGRQYGTAHTAYRLQTSLVPVARSGRHCGAQDLTFEDQKAGQNKAGLAINALPNLAFTTTVRPRGQSFTGDHWHTFAVEVTGKRISWFVDAHVVATETRPAALSGAPMTVRFRLQATQGERMDPARMQMDWLRYWTLRKPDTKSTAAPRPHKTTYADAC